MIIYYLMNQSLLVENIRFAIFLTIIALLLITVLLFFLHYLRYDEITKLSLSFILRVFWLLIPIEVHAYAYLRLVTNTIAFMIIYHTIWGMTSKATSETQIQWVLKKLLNAVISTSLTFLIYFLFRAVELVIIMFGYAVTYRSS
jgi:hypothetical protein